MKSHAQCIVSQATRSCSAAGWHHHSYMVQAIFFCYYQYHSCQTHPSSEICNILFRECTRPMVMKMIHLDLLLHKVQTFPIVIVVIHKCKGKWYSLGCRCLQSAPVEWWELRMMAGDSIGTHYSCLLLCTLPLKNPISLRQKGKQCSWRQIIETTRLIYKKPSGSSHWNLKAIQIA